jgi:hypothetical protein
MSSPLRDLGLDSTESGGSVRGVTVAKGKRKTSEARESQRRLPELLPVLERLNDRRREMHIPTLAKYAKLAGHGVASWHAWAAGVTSPKFLHLRDFARAVGWDLSLTASPQGHAVVEAGTGGDSMARTADDDLTEALGLSGITNPGIRRKAMAAARAAAVKTAVELTKKAGSENPQAPAADVQEPTRGRRKSRGKTGT